MKPIYKILVVTLLFSCHDQKKLQRPNACEILSCTATTFLLDVNRLSANGQLTCYEWSDQVRNPTIIVTPGVWSGYHIYFPEYQLCKARITIEAEGCETWVFEVEEFEDEADIDYLNLDFKYRDCFPEDGVYLVGIWVEAK